MIILFLDFDGVIFTVGGCIHSRIDHEERMPRWELDPVSLSLIKQLLRDNEEIRIVVSSTWRLGTPLEELREILGPELGSKVIGKTPSSKSGYRGREIKAWLNANKHLPIEDILILDDDSDMEPYMGFLFKTDSYDGFKPRDYFKMEAYLRLPENKRRTIRVKKVLKTFLRHTYWGWYHRIGRVRWKIKRLFKEL